MKQMRDILFGDDEDLRNASAKRIAEQSFPNGAEMKCVSCGRSEPVKAEQIADYLLNGMPQCCEIRMTLEANFVWA